MNPNQANTDRNHPNDWQYALCRGVAYWALVFQGQEAIFKQELGALHVAYLLLNPPLEPIHAVALALKARERAGQVAEPDEVFQERGMGLADAAAIRALWRRERALERVLEDRHESEPVTISRGVLAVEPLLAPGFHAGRCLHGRLPALWSVDSGPKRSAPAN